MTRSDQTSANVGPVVENWSVPPYPNQDVLMGNYCQLERLDAENTQRSCFGCLRVTIKCGIICPMARSRLRLSITGG
jgi:hypothetical protein